MKIIQTSISLLSVVALSLIAIPAELASISQATELSSSTDLQRLWRKTFPNSEPQRGGTEGGGKGDSFCPIAPNQFSQVEQVWNERPTFTWAGVLTQIEIREKGNEKVVWSQEISAKNQIELNAKTESSTPLKLYQITTGTALKPGQIYELRVSTNPPIAYRPIPFKIMTPENRDLMTQSLQKLEQELKAKNITGDAAKLQRADYFASQKLWSEFWQEVLSIDAGSEDFKILIHETVKKLCLTS